MITEILPVSGESTEKAAQLLKNGEIVGIPTETVYGLAADAFNEKAVEKIFLAKGRPQENPLIVHICDMEMLPVPALEIPSLAYTLAEHFWPGPLTMIFKKQPALPDCVNNGMPTVAVRMPEHKAALELIKKCGFPLAAPSANLSGKPSPTTAQHVFNDLNGKIPLILDGGKCGFGLESTVIMFNVNGVKILRPGAVTPEMLSEFTEVEIDGTVYRSLESGEQPISPGTKFKHYSPKADVTIIDTENDTLFADYVNSHDGTNTYAIIPSDDKNIVIKTRCFGSTSLEQAANLFDLLRALDDEGAEEIYVRCPEKTGMGLAVYNRLLRSAAFKVINLD